MENNFKGTQERLKLCAKLMKNEHDVEYFTIDFENSKDCIDLYIDKRGIRKNEISRTKADANLITDAFNIRQQINCDLPELLERYNESVRILQELVACRKINFQSSEFPNWKFEKAQQFLKTLE